jgi:hypothetical protein
MQTKSSPVMAPSPKKLAQGHKQLSTFEDVPELKRNNSGTYNH